VLDGFVPGGNSADADMYVAQYWGGASYEGNGSKEDGHTRCYENHKFVYDDVEIWRELTLS
jgi:hypothetical protein